MRRPIVVFTNTLELGDSGIPTGYNIREAAHVLATFSDPLIASIQGGPLAMDPKSIRESEYDPVAKSFLFNQDLLYKLSVSVSLQNITESQWKNCNLLIIVGGLGCYFDMARSLVVTGAVERMFRENKIIACMSHGICCLLDAVNSVNGIPLLCGKSVTTSSVEEEKETGLYDLLPFHLESKLKDIGAKTMFAKPGQSNIMADGILLTSQNSASAQILCHYICNILMSYALPHLTNGWQVDQAIETEQDRVVVIRFGQDHEPNCMRVDECLFGIADKVKNYAVIYLVDNVQVPCFNQMYELYDPCTIMFFFRNKHMMIDLGTGNNNKINWALDNKTEMIDIIETIYRGARKGRGLVVSPKDYSTKHKY